MTGPARLRIVHPGGHASMAQVWLGNQQLHCVTRIEIAPLDLDDRGPVTATLTVVDPEIAIEADLVELVVREAPHLPTEVAAD